MNPELERPAREELELLKRQLQSVIELEQSGMMKDVTEREVREHVQKYGHGAFCVGDFVIKRR